MNPRWWFLFPKHLLCRCADTQRYYSWHHKRSTCTFLIPLPFRNRSMYDVRVLFVIDVPENAVKRMLCYGFVVERLIRFSMDFSNQLTSIRSTEWLHAIWHIYLRAKKNTKARLHEHHKMVSQTHHIITSPNEKSGMILLKSVAVQTTITIFLEWFFDWHYHCHCHSNSEIPFRNIETTLWIHYRSNFAMDSWTCLDVAQT